MSTLWAEAIVVDNMPAEDYHAHAALSSSQVRDLLRTPALYRWRKDHPLTPTRDMELGTAVHTRVLGAGACYDVLPGEDLRVKATKEAAVEMAARGDIALKPSEYQMVRGMAEAIWAHPLAGPLLDPSRGVAERAIFWRDPASGVDCRALIDFSPHNRRSLVDLKTTADASRDAVRKTMARYRYPISAAWYLRGARAAGLVDEDASFIWVFVERDPPHNVAVYNLTGIDMERADAQCTRALEVYADCWGADEWPGYPTDLQTLSMPPWTYDEEPW